MPLIVSLTTIPSRIENLQKVIDSILKQSIKPDRIELNLPKSYSKRSMGTVNKSVIPDGIEVYWLEEDLGPATKVIPTILRYENEPDAQIIYCDDDRVFDRDWIRRLTETSHRNPHSCIAESGYNIESHRHRTYWKSRKITYKILRLLTLGQFKAGTAGNGNIDIAEGYAGVLIKPRFLKNAAIKIPDILWTVDDIWISGLLAYNNINIIETSRCSKVGSEDLVIEGDSMSDKDALRNFVYDDHDRTTSDELCIKYMQENFQVWQHSK